MVKKILPVLFSVFVFTACKKVDIRFGDQFLDNGYAQIVRVDSFSAELSTVYVDSFITSSQGVSLIGGYTDPVFGNINTQCFFEVAPPVYSDIYGGCSFDSLILVFKLNKSYYGDTAKPVHIDVERLTEPIVTAADGSGLYNTQHFAATTAIGSKDVTIRPNVTDSIFIRLDDVLGKALLKKLQDPGDVDILTTDGFLQYFNGLRLSSPGNSRLVFGCKDSVIMRLQYTKPDLYQQHKTVDFLLANKAHHFNHISVDRSATVLKNISSLNNEIPGSLSNNAAYSQYLSGVMAKIRFPTIREIIKTTGYAKILKAALIIRPVVNTFSPLYYLPPVLRLSTTTQLNQVGGDLTVGAGASAAIQTGDLSIDYLYGERTNYVYDVTDYLKFILGTAADNKNGLLLIPPNPALLTEFSRVMIGDKNNALSKIELQVYYASIQ